ncbi:Endothelin-converting enzyme-like protein [Formica fusca]
MLKLLENIGGWNISGKFDISAWSLQNTMHVLHNVYNMGGLFSWTVNEDDNIIHIIQIDQGGLTLPTANYYLNVIEHGKVLAAYLDYMTKVDKGSTYLRARFIAARYAASHRANRGYRYSCTFSDRLLGGEENSTKKQMQAIIDFETKLAKITIPPEKRRDEENNLMLLNKLKRNAPFICLLSPI